MLFELRKLFRPWWQIDHELLRTRIPHSSHRVFDTVRLHADRENVFAIVARRFGYIETQKVLAFQILFDGLKDWRQIVLPRRERRLSIADKKVLSASLFCEFLKALSGTAHRQTSIAWLKEWKVDHVERNTPLQRAINDTI